MAGTTGLEPATSDVTGRRSNQLNYVPARWVNNASNIPFPDGRALTRTLRAAPPGSWPQPARPDPCLPFQATPTP